MQTSPPCGALSANIVDLESGRIFAGRVEWHDGVITRLLEEGLENPGLTYLLPGFIDAHVHIESSMLVPAEFARLATRHGTVATVSDPHEIANVLGIEGVRFMLDNARRVPFKLFFGAPSCVPATPFETTGAEIGLAELDILLRREGLSYLSEVMNFPAVLARDPAVMAKLTLARDLGLPVDGHAPGLTGERARRYAEAGIGTDHECTSLAEAHDKIAAGMAILIREGSAARDFDALHPLIASHPERVMFCSDDKHPDDLARGHIDRLVARAVAAGHERMAVLRCACLNPVRHYRLPVGLLRPGDPMDAVEVAELREFRPLRTWVDGHRVAEAGRSLIERVAVTPLNRFAAARITPADLAVPAGPGRLRVIDAVDGELLTREALLEPRIENGCLVPDLLHDVLLLATINRYRPAPPAVAFARGFGLRHGALASSVAHDSHNIVAVGADAESLCRAVNVLVDAGGGIAVADGAGVQCLPLPVAGLMSTQDGDMVAARYAELTRAAKALGSPLRSPFMTLSFMALLVIPELKLSDRGLFDARKFRFTSLLA
ncbi:MAG: adenine deaminase [bacterium]|nr:MAG: adenine deaminase [bacterium]KAF0148824.1 MAG: adenine deaminase [bacterium]KAF0167315.1 MAG: adenine deaminase [bacterium]TXT17419.1 MAG: adenine deaminase [bacterium]